MTKKQPTKAHWRKTEITGRQYDALHRRVTACEQAVKQILRLLK